MYVKLWSDLLDSSLWVQESPETRIVWITLLAMADADGMMFSLTNTLRRGRIKASR